MKRMTVSLKREASLDAFTKLIVAQKRVDVRARKLREEAQKCASDHLRAFPLTPAVKAKLVALVRGGMVFCCPGGRGGVAKMTELVDSIWAQALNTWAYEKLSCHPNTDADRFDKQADRLAAALDDGTIVERWRWL